MKKEVTQKIATDSQMLALGKKLSAAATQIPACVIYLNGELGAGKTTLVRGILRGLGYETAVKSPTYNLVEIYALPSVHLYHWDLYRISDPMELEQLGIRDYEQTPAWWLIEWPERAKEQIPKPDLLINIAIQGKGRELSFEGKTSIGQQLLERL